MARHVFLTGPPGIGKTTLIQKATEILKSSGLPIDGFYTEEVREGGRRIGFDVVTLSGRRGVLSRVGCGPSTARHEYRVGQYVVDLASFEQLTVPLLRNGHQFGNTDDIIREVEEWFKVQSAHFYSNSIRRVKKCWEKCINLDDVSPAEFSGVYFEADLGSSAVKKVCVIDEIGKMELFSQSFIQAVHQMLSGSGIVMLGTIPMPKGKPLGIVEEIRTNKEVKVFTITKENRDNILEDIVTAVQNCLK